MRCAAVTFVLCATGVATAQDATLETFLQQVERWQARRHSRARPAGPTADESRRMMPVLLKALDGGKAPLRARVARVLRWMYPRSDGAAAALLAQRRHADPAVRLEVVRTLGLFLPDAPAIVPAMVQMLGDPDAKVRESTALTLGMFGANSRAAVPELNALARRDPDPSVRAAAVEALLWTGAPTQEEVLAWLKSPVPQVGIAAADVVARSRQLGRLDLAGALGALVADDDVDHRLRQLAFQALSAHYSAHPAALRAAGAALRAERVQGRGLHWRDLPEHERPWHHDFGTDLALVAADALRAWPLPAARVTELIKPEILAERRWDVLLTLLELKGEPDGELAARLARGLPASGAPEGRTPASQIFRILLKSPMPRDRIAALAAPQVAKGRRFEAIQILGACGPAAAPHVPMLLGLMEGTPHLRPSILQALQKIGSVPPDHASALRAMVTDPKQDPTSRQVAAQLLAGTGAAGVRSLLELGAAHGKDDVARMAYLALGHAGAAGSAAVPVLVDLNAGPMPMEVVGRDALTRLGAVAAARLVDELQSPDPVRAYKAAIVFKAMGARARPFTGAVLAAWEHWRGGPSDARNFTAAAVVALGSAAFPGLRDRVRGGGAVGAAAAQLIGQLEGVDLAPHLEALRSLPDTPPIRRARVRALTESADGRSAVLGFAADPSASVRDAVQTAIVLQRWTGEDVVAAVLALARAGSAGALGLLDRMGSAADAARPTLLAMAEDPAHPQAELALSVLAAIGPGPRGAELLRAALASADPDRAAAGHRAASRLDAAGAYALAPAIRALLAAELRAAAPDAGRIGRLLVPLLRARPVDVATRELIAELASHRDAAIRRIGQDAANRRGARDERTLPWLSMQVRRIVQGPSSGQLEPLLEELQRMDDPRARPALRMAAASR